MKVTSRSRAAVSRARLLHELGARVVQRVQPMPRRHLAGGQDACGLVDELLCHACRAGAPGVGVVGNISEQAFRLRALQRQTRVCEVGIQWQDRVACGHEPFDLRERRVADQRPGFALPFVPQQIRVLLDRIVAEPVCELRRREFATSQLGIFCHLFRWQTKARNEGMCIVGPIAPFAVEVQVSLGVLDALDLIADGGRHFGRFPRW